MINHNKLHDLSCQYWTALDQMDYEWADFIASCLEVRGLVRLEKSECK